MAAARPQEQTAKSSSGFDALWRFLPMLWPEGQLEL
jgi:hypothetical protein